MTDWSLFYTAITAFTAILALVGTMLAFFTRLIVRGALSDFRIELLEQLNGRYLKADIATTLIQRADERQAQNRADIEDLYRLLECKRTKG